jgi:ATP-dependent Clp protease protease subunit
MGSILLTCGEKGKRYAIPNSEVLLHQPLGGAGGQCSDIQIQAKHIQYYKDKLEKLLSERTGQPIDVITEACDRDNWMTAQQALEFGIIDEVISKTRND